MTPKLSKFRRFFNKRIGITVVYWHLSSEFTNNVVFFTISCNYRISDVEWEMGFPRIQNVLKVNTNFVLLLFFVFVFFCLLFFVLFCFVFA